MYLSEISYISTKQISKLIRQGFGMGPINKLE